MRERRSARPRDVVPGHRRPRGRPRVAARRCPRSPRSAASGCSGPAPSASFAPTSDSTRRSARPRRCPGRLALVAQSGAVCTAMLDFAGPMQIGFSTVMSLGGGIDVELRRIARRAGPGSGDRRHPALRRKRGRCARVPVGAARGGAHQARGRAQGRAFARAVARTDALDSARRRPTRCSTRRSRAPARCACRTYTQLFAAARILAMGKIPRGDRLAIVSNGRGPGTAGRRLRRGRRRRARASSAPDTVRRWTRCCRRRSRAAIPSTCAAMRRPRGSPPRLRPRCRIPRSTRCWRCTCRARSRRPSTRRTPSPRSRAAPPSRCWRVARRGRPAGRARRAGGGRHRQFLHAGKRGRSVFVPRGVSPQPGMAARGAAVAAGSRAARSRRGGAHPRAARRRAGRGMLPLSRRADAARGVRHRPAAAARGRDTLAEAQAAARKLRYPVTLDAGLRRPMLPASRGGIRSGRALARA